MLSQLSYIPTFKMISGSHLLSHVVSNIVPSAARVLTVVFGMGTGVSPGRIATGIFSLLLSVLSSHLADQQQYSPYFFPAALRRFLRKEVTQPHLPVRLPCYDFTPVTGPALGGSLLSVGLPTSGISGSHGVTGGVYKTRERIHRGILIRDY